MILPDGRIPQLFMSFHPTVARSKRRQQLFKYNNVSMGSTAHIKSTVFLMSNMNMSMRSLLYLHAYA